MYNKWFDCYCWWYFFGLLDNNPGILGLKNSPGWDSLSQDRQPWTLVGKMQGERGPQSRIYCIIRWKSYAQYKMSYTYLRAYWVPVHRCCLWDSVGKVLVSISMTAIKCLLLVDYSVLCPVYKVKWLAHVNAWHDNSHSQPVSLSWVDSFVTCNLVMQSRLTV